MATTIERAGYDTLAPTYDLLTADYDYDRWLREILRRAHAHGFRGRRALDVACGTGNSFVPLLAAGFDVVACDCSAGMLAVAATKVPDPRAIRLHDMTALPLIGKFDLITCLDDAINHLLSADQVLAAFRGMAANLAADGLLVFDINTVAAYRTAFASCDVFETSGRVITWRGLGETQAAPGCCGEVQIDVFAPDPQQDGLWRRETSNHRERHYPVAEVEGLLNQAGLEIVDCLGQSPGVRLDPHVDEEVHSKALFLARHARRDRREAT